LEDISELPDEFFRPAFAHNCLTNVLGLFFPQ